MNDKAHTTRSLFLKLTIFVALGAAFASASGLFSDNLYRDNSFIISALQGNDLVTLFLAVPLLLVSAWRAGRGSSLFSLLWSGALAYMVYNYLFYLYGAAFNRLFLIYAAVAVLSLYSLIFSLITLDREAYRDIPLGGGSLFAGIYLLFFGGTLLVLWTLIPLSFVFTGTVPEAITQTGLTTAVVFATDLVFLIPSVLLSGFLLLSRRTWGFLLSAVVLTKSCAYSLVLTVMHFLNRSRGEKGDPFVPLWMALGALALVSLVLLLRPLIKKEPRPQSTKGDGAGIRKC